MSKGQDRKKNSKKEPAKNQERKKSGQAGEEKRKE